MTFESWFYCFTVTYSVNMERRVQCRLLVQTLTTFRIAPGLICGFCHLWGRWKTPSESTDMLISATLCQTAVGVSILFSDQFLFNHCFSLLFTSDSHELRLGESSSSLARQSLVDPGLLEEFCPFVSVKGRFLPAVDPKCSRVLDNTLLPSQFWSSYTSCSLWLGVEYLLKGSFIAHTCQVPCPC
jgi:hypothetical protein